MFVFGVPSQGFIKWHLHCGDFRADSSIFNQKLKYFHNEEALKFDQDFMFQSVYLDTTYAHPKHSFPPQEQVIAACVDGFSRLLHGQYDPAGQKRLVPLKWIIAIGSYLIGKERIILALAETFDLLIYADQRKRSILKLLQWPELQDRLTDDPLATPLHFVSMSLLSKQKLTDYKDSFQGKFSHILGIRPTGWTFTGKESEDEREWNLALPKVDGNVGIWPVPYSEHSSYKELQAFLKKLSVHQIIPTVDNHADVVLDSRRLGGDNLKVLAQWAARKDGFRR